MRRLTYTVEEVLADVLALLDQLGLRRVGLVAQDFSAVVGFRLCFDHPERVAAFLCLGEAAAQVRAAASAPASNALAPGLDERLLSWSMSHPNEHLLRGAYGMRNQGEVFGARDLLRDDVVWHTLSGDVHGVERVLAMLAQSDEIASGTISREVHACSLTTSTGWCWSRSGLKGRVDGSRTARCTSYVPGRQDRGVLAVPGRSAG
jgi:pimeloyl-ACP methyl ester carboxylesterase